MKQTAFIRNANGSRIITTRRHPSSKILISPSCTRTYTTITQAKDRHSIIHIPTGSYIYAFGAPSHTRTPLLRGLDWNVNDGEAWAIISGGGGRGKKIIFNTLLGNTRIAPPAPGNRWAEQGGLYPFLSASSVDPYTRISHVAFRQRTGSHSGTFFDYTARYGAMREAEDRVTLRDNLNPSGGSTSPLFETLTVQMNLTSLLDLPLLALSNGQTRRARIVKAILDKPELLLLDEPFTGLDPQSRKRLNEALAQLHLARSPRIILGLRNGEEVPAWITHVLDVRDGTASARHLLDSSGLSHLTMDTAEEAKPPAMPAPPKYEIGNVVVDLKDVNVTYGTRKVLKNITWQIKQGERWHLQGANGSGKTTLLALLTGDHPQSYTQAHLNLPSLATSSPTSPFATFPPAPHHFTLRPRKQTPTAHLRTLVGVVSPEMFDAFPRRHPGMNLWEAVTTGFNGGFVPRNRGACTKSSVGWVDVDDDELGAGWYNLSDHEKEIRRAEIQKWRVGRCWEVLEALGPASWNSSLPLKSHSNTQTSAGTIAFASIPFSSISPGEQRLVLLMRALVGRPPLVLLDEAWSGMDDGMIAAARRYLRGDCTMSSSADAGDHGMAGVGEDQAVVVITHWEDEVPWTGKEVKKFRLD
ncbi:P-loop containing nucleoside triphosphate hydrolase protein [Phlegmacium glaucopus]|nr:P-loop containing nucleoside triphosphate hydrolase protein [Phlegmacium glaucopus]